MTLENAATTTEEHGTDAEYNSADLNNSMNAPGRRIFAAMEVLSMSDADMDIAPQTTTNNYAI